jgi:hypothetical protein
MVPEIRLIDQLAYWLIDRTSALSLSPLHITAFITVQPWRELQGLLSGKTTSRRIEAHTHVLILESFYLLGRAGGFPFPLANVDAYYSESILTYFALFFP